MSPGRRKWSASSSCFFMVAGAITIVSGPRTRAMSASEKLS
jgi:hypothetical protein